jgi:hypothetical protein
MSLESPSPHPVIRNADMQAGLQFKRQRDSAFVRLDETNLRYNSAG